MCHWHCGQVKVMIHICATGSRRIKQAYVAPIFFDFFFVNNTMSYLFIFLEICMNTDIILDTAMKNFVFYEQKSFSNLFGVPTSNLNENSQI